jgi:hypothetical protein
MKKEIFIVKAIFGTRNDFWSNDVIAFHSKEEAEKYTEKLKKVYKKCSNLFNELLKKNNII